VATTKERSGAARRMRSTM